MKSKKKVIALAAVLGIVGIGGTLAYFNQTLTATNIFDTGKYDTELVEEFKPSEGENWEPGSNVNKDVTVRNTGTLPVVVRVKFQEKWVRGDETLYSMDTTVNKDKLAVGSPSNAENKFENVYQADANDGLTGEDVDDSVVYKQMIPDGGWTYNPEDGYYYYHEVLASEAETTKLLDGVTLSENTDMGAYKEMKFYATTENRPEDNDDNWIEFATDSNAQYVSTKEMSDRVQNDGKMITFLKSMTRLQEDKAGYSQADYSLIVTAQTVQATDKAVNTVFGNGTTFTPPEGCSWTLISEDEIQK